MKKASEILKAKKIFFNYLGSSYYMKYDGILNDYKSFGISKAQEMFWKEELRRNLITKLNKSDYSVINDLRTIGNIDVLPKILKITPKGNGWTKLRFAEDLWSFSEETYTSPEELNLIIQACKKAVQIWQMLLDLKTNPGVPDKILEIADRKIGAEEYFKNRLDLNIQKASKFIRLVLNNNE